MSRDEVEKALLAKLMQKKDYYYTFFTVLDTDLFESLLHKEVFSVIDTLYQQGESFDIIKADKISNLNAFNMQFEIAKIMSFESYYMPFESCVEYLINEKKLVKFKNLIIDLSKRCGEEDINSLIEYSVEKLGSIGEHNDSGLPDMNHQLEGFLYEVHENCKKEGITGITSGYKSIDEHTNGWKNQDLIIVGGASSMGKTSLSLNLALNAAKSDIPTVVFSYEMSVNQLLTRVVSSESYVENKSISSGELSKEDYDRVIDYSNKVKSLPMYIDECSNTSLRYLINRIRRYVVSKKVKLVMIDYLQLVNNFNKGRSREQEVSQIARALKNVAKELDICVMALSQLSRNVQNRAGCRPCLADLRESGEIEQAADTVVFVYRPEYYGIESDENGNSTIGKAEIIFAKGRNIGIGSVNLDFNNKFTKFVESSSDNSFFTVDEL
tara:strand:- start:5210 stop:6526 length:1317 start_codon:yes stop_codon:yes gene_type:complete